MFNATIEQFLRVINKPMFGCLNKVLLKIFLLGVVYILLGFVKKCGERRFD